MKILGCDPGEMFGWAVWDSDADRPIDHLHGEIKFAGPYCRSAGQRAELMKEILQPRFRKLFEEEDVRWMAIEKMRSFGNGADRALHTYASTLIHIADTVGMKHIEIHIPTVKKRFAGTGRATKEDIQTVVKMRYQRIFREHEADAVAIAYSAYEDILEKMGMVGYGAIVQKLS